MWMMSYIKLSLWLDQRLCELTLIWQKQVNGILYGSSTPVEDWQIPTFIACSDFCFNQLWSLYDTEVPTTGFQL